MVWSLQASYELSDQQFDQWSKLLEERTGIQLASRQRGFLQTQISMRMREKGVSDHGQYFQQVVEGVQGLMEWSTLVDRLVVKETSFFRHRASVEFVRRFLQNRIDNRVLDDSFDAWSVGCATGEEPYSLAMVMNDCFELASLDPYYSVMATDISLPALEFARQGRYSERKFGQITSQERARYFSRDESSGGGSGREQICGGDESGRDESVRDEGDGCKAHKNADTRYIIDAKLRDRVCFSRGNVLNISEMPAVKMDVIFCQNLLIYFRRWRRRGILNALVERLKPGGVLIIGLGEVVEWEHQCVRRVSDDRIQAYARR